MKISQQQKSNMFDWFMRKSKAIAVKLFKREIPNKFGLNIILPDRSEHSLFTNDPFRIMSFSCRRAVNDGYDLSVFRLEAFPNELKEAVIDSLAMSKKSVILYDQTIVFPQVSSIEELAIKIELEA